MNGDQTIFASVLCEIVDGLLDGFGNGAHSYDNVLGVRVSIILKGSVCPSC